jgi:hypothetical protein
MQLEKTTITSSSRRYQNLTRLWIRGSYSLFVVFIFHFIN